MSRTFFDQDIWTLSDFRANASALIQQVRQTKRPMVITQHGKSAAILLDVKEYEALQDQLELLQDIHLAESQVQAGQGVPHDKAKSQILKQLKQ